VAHSNARLTPRGRQILIEKIASGRPVAHVAKEMGISRTTAWRWWRRWQAEGADGLADRSSVATSHPGRVPAYVEDQILRMRAENRRGAAWIAHQMGLPPSTVGKVLARHNVPLLRSVDPLTGELTKARRASSRRYEHKYPGSLVHVDVKKLGRIPDGGGWRVHGRDNAPKGSRVGYDFIHVMIDDYSRVVYAEVLGDERGPTLRGVHPPGRLLVRGVGRGHRAGDHRQPFQLPAVAGLRAGRGVDRGQAEVHPAAAPVDEREGGAVQPHDGAGMGLCPALPQ
jgi:transposase-like protein